MEERSRKPEIGGTHGGERGVFVASQSDFGEEFEKTTVLINCRTVRISKNNPLLIKSKKLVHEIRVHLTARNLLLAEGL